MSLRLRIVCAIALVLVLGSMTGIGVAGWQARQVLREELTAALAGGGQTVAGALQDLPASAHPDRDLRRLISSFNGNRHLIAVLHGVDGHVLIASRPLNATTAPGWFTSRLGFPLAPERMPVPIRGYGSLTLVPVFANDVGAIWTEFLDLIVVLGLSLLIGSAFVWLTVGRALRPLSNFTDAFLRIGSGDYDARIAEHGPLELVRLGQGVNRMAERLNGMHARNQALETQLSTLQEEERADLARDLHDEIGPHLFAMKVDAAMARLTIEGGGAGDALGPVKAIEAGVAHVQALVRDILGRLRPIELVDLGLTAAVGDLVSFWRSRRPAIQFHLCLAADGMLPQAVRETLYRVIQEGLNNAVRHGKPHQVRIEVSGPSRGWVVARITDDGAHAGTPGPAGFGLIGMRERVAAVNGELTIDQGAPGKGWTIVARLPVDQAAPA